ncbi:MAG: cytochrome b N-terminal domain-containing protein, partial [Candidatus Dormibacter sp.]
MSSWLIRPITTRLRAGMEWFDDRTGATELLHKGLYEAVPKKGGWAYALGSATLALILLQLFTGIFLLLDYVPSVTDAYKSLDYLRTSDAFGAWVRGLHLWGSYTLILVIGLHMLRTFLSASYKRPRELNWVSGALLFFLVLGLAITGAMLPWDQAAYWTTVVVTNIPHYIPFVGDGIRKLLRGGDFVGPITLTRTFA